MSVYVLARSVKISSDQRRPKKCRNGGNSEHDLAHVRQAPGVRRAFVAELLARFTPRLCYVAR